jgi:hypothetical protein
MPVREGRLRSPGSPKDPHRLRPVHRPEVRVRHHHLVPQLLQGLRTGLATKPTHSMFVDASISSFAFPRAPSTSANRPRSVWMRCSNDFAFLRNDAQLSFLLVHVDAKPFHGWPPLRLLTALLVGGTQFYHHVPWRPAASPHLWVKCS